MSAYDVPDWAWDLVIALQKYRDEHPPLYRIDTTAEGKVEHVRAECFDHSASGIIPRDVWLAAEAIAMDRARRAAS